LATPTPSRSIPLPISKSASLQHDKCLSPFISDVHAHTHAHTHTPSPVHTDRSIDSAPISQRPAWDRLLLTDFR
jgi:hypothetical protein